MVQSGGTTTTRAFNDAGQMLGESYAGGPLDGVSVANGFDDLLRRTGVSALNSTTPLLQHSYAFSPTSGRLQTVTDNLTLGTTHSAHYSYLANSPLVSSIVFKQNSTTRMTTTKSYDLLNRLASISSVPSVSSVVGFTYAYNSAGQRYQVNVVADGETSQWQYGYDTLGQVISGKHLMGEVRLAGEHFEYAFDTIGNRKSTKSGGEASFFYPTTLRSSAYTVNALNQYTSRTVPGYVEVLGVATNAAAKVWVNQQAPERHPIFPTHFRKELTVANTAGPVWLNVTNLAILNQGGSPDLIATNKGNVLVPKTPEVFTYDLDGNQTSDSLWVNTWNAENRRVVIESSVSSGTGVPPVARAREQWTHLPDGRWIERIVSTNNGSAYVPVLTNRYVWDGHVLLAVLNNVNGLELSFMRGLDLSGTMQGAGGVGGLLAVFSPSAINSQPSTHFAAYDGNGNVTMLVNAADGTESARYEYGPFAEPLRMTGPMAKLNPIRFSTQYADDVTGDIKYLYRDYTAGTGRWRSRDPIEERGSLSLYGFVSNDPISKKDRFGLHLAAEIPAEIALEIEAGVSLAQIAADFGITLEQVAMMAAALAADTAIQQVVNNARRNAKGNNPCEKAKDALRQVQKGIQNTLDTINQHQSWVNNPSSYPGGLLPPFDQHPEWAVDKWLKQIANMQANLERMNADVKVLQKAVDAACKCLYKPWTWLR